MHRSYRKGCDEKNEELRRLVHVILFQMFMTESAYDNSAGDSINKPGNLTGYAASLEMTFP